MKTFIPAAVLLFAAASASAQVIIYKDNVKNSDSILIQSLQTGKQYKAVDAGAAAIVSDDALKNESNGQFTVLVNKDPVTMYCQSVNKDQFLFNYTQPSTVKKTTMIKMTEDNNGLHCILAK